MPNNAVIQFQSSGVPIGYCPPNYATLFNDFAASLTGYLPGAYITVLTGDTEPQVNDRDKPWIRSDGRWYQYSAPGLGQWVARHPLAPGSVMLYAAAAEADIWSFDGGDGTNPASAAPTAATGAMWEKVSELDGRIPIGPGTLPLSGTVLAPGNTGGLDQITLVQANLPELDFQCKVRNPQYPAGGVALGGLGNGGGNNQSTTLSTTAGQVIAESGGSDEPFTNMPPYYTIYFIRRTARIWLTI